MIRVIDRNPITQEVVQKITKPTGALVGYQYGIPGQYMTQVTTLVEARACIGKTRALSLTDAISKQKATQSSHA